MLLVGPHIPWISNVQRDKTWLSWKTQARSARSWDILFQREPEGLTYGQSCYWVWNIKWEIDGGKQNQYPLPRSIPKAIYSYSYLQESSSWLSHWSHSKIWFELFAKGHSTDWTPMPMVRKTITLIYVTPTYQGQKLNISAPLARVDVQLVLALEGVRFSASVTSRGPNLDSKCGFLVHHHVM